MFLLFAFLIRFQICQVDIKQNFSETLINIIRDLMNNYFCKHLTLVFLTILVVWSFAIWHAFHKITQVFLNTIDWWFRIIRMCPKYMSKWSSNVHQEIETCHQKCKSILIYFTARRIKQNLFCQLSW